MALMRSFCEELTGRGKGLFLLTGDQTYVGFGYAPEAVRYIAGKGALILGFEGFVTDGKQVKPTLEYIADLDVSSSAAADRIRTAAEAALRALTIWEREGGPEFVEFVVEEQEST